MRKARHYIARWAKTAASFIKRRSLVAAIALLALVIGLEVAVLANASGGGDFVSRAREIVDRCSDSSYKPTCYDEEIPKLMSRISMEDAFEVTRAVQDIDTSYKYCHVLGHKLSAIETAKDPSDWKSVIGRCPSGICSNGCVHGAFQERFRKEYLSSTELSEVKDEFRNVCEPREGFDPTGLEQGSCYHALGHLTMYVTNADIDASLELCKELAMVDGRDWTQLCYDGVFMQIFQPLEPDDFALIEGKEIKSQAEHEKLCGLYTGKERSACWSEGWPLYRAELMQPGRIISYCSRLTERHEQARCFSALMYVLTPQMGFDGKKVAAFCEAMPESHKGNCFAQAAGRMIETDYRNGPLSVELCKAAEPHDPQGLCYKELVLYSTYNFHAGSPESVSLCEALPGEWKDRCLQRGAAAR